MKKSVMAIFLLIILIIIVVVLNTSITQIDVSGNEKYTAEEIENYIFEKKYEYNSAYFFVEKLFNKKKEIPFVQDYNVIFNSPRHIEIIVYEKSLVGYIDFMSSKMYFDKDGIIVESSTSIIEGIPKITGLKFGNIVLYQKLPVENDKIFDDILLVTQNIAVYKIPVDRIEYDSSYKSKLYIGELIVDLGENRNTNAKILTLRDMLPAIEERGIKSGTLHLENFDPNNSDIGISLTP